MGTFVSSTLSDASLSEHEPLRQELRSWLERARGAGLDDESIEALFLSTFRTHAEAPSAEASSTEEER
ncbi:hypothetical protein PV390_16375 [Streptomyces sp. ME02-6991-2A]|uniref:hypothetical protein n=1 Tax=Streptomyces sp. ME02-6991-2A TaxID=3028677 RepID=UPI00211B1CAB|nr:hypothetical protein [Streptomyces sp. ME02-6991-2A]MDX3375972.1 hypothetical protein [Streptomyces sp. ME02-6991-2A]